MPHARPQTWLDARTRNISKGPPRHKVCGWILSSGRPKEIFHLSAESSKRASQIQYPSLSVEIQKEPKRVILLSLHISAEIGSLERDSNFAELQKDQINAGRLSTKFLQKGLSGQPLILRPFSLMIALLVYQVA